MTEKHVGDSESGDDHDSGSDQEGGHDPTTLPAPRRRRWWPWIVGVVIVALVAAGLFVPTSYNTFGPGSLWETEAKIDVEGAMAFDSSGDIRYATVSVRQASVFELVRAYLDDTIDVQKFEERFPSGDPEEQKIYNQKQMDDSKLTALFVALSELEVPVELTGTGAFVDAVVDGMPADGILEQGDVIEAVDGVDVRTTDDLTEELEDEPVGAAVTLTVRNPETVSQVAGVNEVEVELAQRLDEDGEPVDEERGYLGIAVSTAEQDLDLPFDIELDSGEVTGPSAGLAWTLGVIDRLSPDDLTGGELVAVTGEIAIDGSVGTIGGVVQKVKAALSEGADMFLYPAETDPEEVAIITEMAEGEIELHPVETVDDALDVLLDGEALTAAPIE